MKECEVRSNYDNVLGEVHMFNRSPVFEVKDFIVGRGSRFLYLSELEQIVRRLRHMQSDLRDADLKAEQESKE